METIDTGIKLLAFMVRNTSVGADVLIEIFEKLPADEQQRVRDAFEAVASNEGNTDELDQRLTLI